MGDFFRQTWDVFLRFAGAMGALPGGGGLHVFCVLTGADDLSGLLLALPGKSKRTADGRLSANACFLGLMRKGMMLLVILLAAMLDSIAGQEDMLRRAATGFYICNECISLMENAALLGVLIPGSLRRALGAIAERERTENGNAWQDSPLCRGEKPRHAPAERMNAK